MNRRQFLAGLVSAFGVAAVSGAASVSANEIVCDWDVERSIDDKALRPNTETVANACKKEFREGFPENITRDLVTGALAGTTAYVAVQLYPPKLG